FHRAARRLASNRDPPAVATAGVTPITFSGEALCDPAGVQQEGNVMGKFHKVIIARILLFAVMSIATPAAAATFDGEWNVQIASTSSVCGGGATVSIGINNGQVASTNALMTASGRVADAGIISVTLISGIKRAVGWGHLSAT